MLDADHVFHTRLLEDSADELRVAGCHEHEVKLALVLLDHLFELLSADQFAAPDVVLEDQKVTLILVLLVKVCSKIILAVEDAVTAEVKSKRVHREHLLDAVLGALAFGDLDGHSGCVDAISDL